MKTVTSLRPRMGHDGVLEFTTTKATVFTLYTPGFLRCFEPRLCTNPLLLRPIPGPFPSLRPNPNAKTLHFLSLRLSETQTAITAIIQQAPIFWLHNGIQTGR